MALKISNLYIAFNVYNWFLFSVSEIINMLSPSIIFMKDNKYFLLSIYNILESFLPNWQILSLFWLYHTWTNGKSLSGSLESIGFTFIRQTLSWKCGFHINLQIHANRVWCRGLFCIFGLMACPGRSVLYPSFFVATPSSP